MFKKLWKRILIWSGAFLTAVDLVIGVLYAVNYKPPGTLTIFSGAAPGAVIKSADGSNDINLANDAIDFARKAKIDIVNNYSALDANPSDLSNWLAYTRKNRDKFDVKVGINMTYFVDPRTDAPNQQYYDLYGSTMEDQKEPTVKLIRADTR